MSRPTSLPEPHAPPAAPEEPRRVRPLLSVVVPVYNGGESIAGNVETIAARVRERLDAPFEIVVVSDGSIDRTAEALLERRSGDVRVLPYDRNLGKGYAVKLGALAARGDWIAYVDSDLDLDPSSIPDFLERAREEGLDFAIGSKRHPDSRVLYPRSRRVASWLYQQLVRLLFRLDVRDTQVGLKIFRREVAEQVLPLLIVKRFAFDLELLAVARALGFSRLRELPVSLDYRFTGSGVRSVAVLRALLDTAGIFYRLRILRYYQRKRAFLGGEHFERALDYEPLVTVVASGTDALARLDYERLELVELEDDTPRTRAEAAARASGDVVAFLPAGSAPAGNWISSAVPFLGRPQVAAVVAPLMAPHHGTLRHRAAAAVGESRLGGGSLFYRATPGNLRFVREFPAANVVARKADVVAVAADGVDVDLCERLAAAGKRTVYTPETVVVIPKAPLFRPHLVGVAADARRRARAVRTGGLARLRLSTVGALVLGPVLAAALVAPALPGAWRLVALAPAAAYAAGLVVAATAAAFRFRSARVGALALAGLAATHAVYAAAFVAALARGR